MSTPQYTHWFGSTQLTMRTKTPSLAVTRAVLPSTRNTKSPPPPKPLPQRALTGFTPRLTRPLPVKSLQTRSAQLPKRSIPPAKSVAKAKSVFKNFSLSRFAKADKAKASQGMDALPSNYVDRLKVKDPAAVRTQQKALIAQQLQKLPETNTQNLGMTLAFPSEQLDEIKKALPGLQKDGGNIQLDDLLKYIRGKMSGTTFYSSGNPVLRRLTLETQLRSQAGAIVQSIMDSKGAAKTSTPQRARANKNTTKRLTPNQGGRK